MFRRRPGGLEGGGIPVRPCDLDQAGADPDPFCRERDSRLNHRRWREQNLNAETALSRNHAVERNPDPLPFRKGMCLAQSQSPAELCQLLWQAALIFGARREAKRYAALDSAHAQTGTLRQHGRGPEIQSAVAAALPPRLRLRRGELQPRPGRSAAQTGAGALLQNLNAGANRFVPLKRGTNEPSFHKPFSTCRFEAKLRCTHTRKG